MEILKPDERAIEKAAKALSDGLLVAFPTETVYGLGAHALDAQALQRLYAAKGRPADHPVIVHLASADELPQWASSVPPAAMALAESLWPGPMTLILPKAAHVPDQVTGGQKTVGLRVPAHPVALRLLREFKSGVAAPSANKFGKLSPTSADDVAQGFSASEIAVVIDGGICEVGIESTIIDFSGANPRILRPGMILPEQIQALIAPFGCRLLGNVTGSQTDPHHDTKSSTEPITRAPGTLASHYAPVTPLITVAASQLPQSVDDLSSQGKRVCVLSFSVKPRDLPGIACWIEAPREPELFARQLYRSLRKLDREDAQVILVENVPDSESWAGIADRLKRASAAAGASTDSLSTPR